VIEEEIRRLSGLERAADENEKSRNKPPIEVVHR
jgi:hypothetical protein